MNVKCLAAMAALCMVLPLRADDSPREHILFSNGIVNPASPEAWSMIKFGDPSVNLYSGSLGLSIPFYTYSDDDFTLPVSFDYGFCGYRPNVSTGTMGLGWYFNVGGCITRDVNGIMDDAWPDLEMYNYRDKWYGGTRTGGYLSIAVFGYAHYCQHGFDEIDVLRDRVYGNKAGEEYMSVLYSNDNDETMYEYEPDVFHFSMPRHSGSFILSPDGGIFSETSGPSKLYSLEYTLGRSGFTSFTIITPDRYRYVFACVERAYSWSDNASDDGVGTPGSWRLTRIVAPSGRILAFNYGVSGYSQTLSPCYVDDYNYKVARDEASGADITDDRSYYTAAYTSCSYVESFCPTMIETSDSTVRLVLDYRRKALERGSYDYPSYLLTGISVYSAEGRSVRSCTLVYRNEHAVGTESYDSTRLCVTFLDSLLVSGEGAYVFRYNDIGSSPDLGTKGTDWYGYWRTDTDSWSGFAPTVATARSGNGHLLTLRQGSFSHALWGSLSEAVYPTGGKISVEWEPNRYGRDDTGVDARSGGGGSSGIRVAAVNTSDADGRVLKRKEYSYMLQDGTSSGVLLWRPILYSEYSSRTSSPWKNLDRKTLSTASDYVFSRYPHLEYLRVVETTYDPENPLKREIVENTFLSGHTSSARSNFVRRNDYMVDDDGFILALTPGNMADTTAARLPEAEQSPLAGKPLSRTVYSDDWDHPVSRMEYSWQSPECTSIITPVIKAGMAFNHYMVTFFPSMGTERLITYGSSGEAMTLRETTNTLDGLFRLSVSETSDSDGNTLTNQYSYFSPVPAWLSEAVVFRGGKLSGAKKYEYIRPAASSLPSFWMPWKVSTARVTEQMTSPSIYDTDMTVSIYSAGGKPIEVTDKAGVRTCYVWVWKGLCQAMKIEGTDWASLVSAVPSLGSGVFSGPLPSSVDAAVRSLPGLVVTTWSHRPLVGILSVKDPSGKILTYEYDADGRLTGAYNAEGMKTLEYEYHILTEEGE